MAKKRDEYRRIAVEIEGQGIVLLIDKTAKDVDTSKIQTKTFLKIFRGAARRFSSRDNREQECKKKRETSRERIFKIISIVKDSFRGIEIPSENLRLVVYPKVTPEYDRDLLEKSTDELFASVAFEDLILKINLPKDKTSREEVVKKIKEALGEEAYNRLVTEETELRIDEKELDRLVALKKIFLLDGTKTEETVWNVKASKLRKE